MKNQRPATAILRVTLVVLLLLALRLLFSNLGAASAAEAKRRLQVCPPHPQPVPVEVQVICDCSKAGGVAGSHYTGAGGSTYWWCLVKGEVFLAEYK